MASSLIRSRGLVVSRRLVSRTTSHHSLVSGHSTTCSYPRRNGFPSSLLLTRCFSPMTGGIHSSNSLSDEDSRSSAMAVRKSRDSSSLEESLELEHPTSANNTNPALKSLGIENTKIRSTTNDKPTVNNWDRHKRRKHRNSVNNNATLHQRPHNSRSVRVKAVHAAQTLDVVKVLSGVFGHSTKHMFGKTGVFVELPVNEDDEGLAHRFVAIFRFGSVVMFNVPPREAGKLLEEVKRVGGMKPTAPGFERQEHFEVVIYPQLRDTAHVVNGDYCIVESLGINGVAVIASIMGQTVALDSYSDTVDELLANFASINSNVVQLGKNLDVEKSALFRVVSMNNSISIDMVSKLGIKDRSDMAWNLIQYERVHQGLKDEFEIEHRSQNIEFKLDLIQQNAKFFLEILHSQKSNSLEWIIIVLIAFECVLMILEMSGLGYAMFGLTPPV